jgi:hypothetical protein
MKKKYLEYKKKYLELKNNCYGVWNELPDELYIIGDVHGDFYAMKQALELTTCVLFDKISTEEIISFKNKEVIIKDGCDLYKNKIKWNVNKNNCFIVFVGDIIDRCEDNDSNKLIKCNTVFDENCDYSMLETIFELDLQAKNHASRVLCILGEHEIANLQNDFTYISDKGLNDVNRLYNIKKLIKKNYNNVYSVIRINKYIITHGSLNPIYVEKIKPKLIKYKKEFIQQFNNTLQINIKNLIDNENYDEDFLTKINKKDNEIYYKNTLYKDRYMNTHNDCFEITKLLDIQDKNIIDDITYIIAHSIQNNNINKIKCKNSNNYIIKVDVGMSRRFNEYNYNYINKNIDNLKNLIDNNNIINFYKTKNDGNNITINKNTKVQILKITPLNEEIITNNIYSINYIYNEIFPDTKYNNYKYCFILQDIINFFKDDYTIDKTFLNKINNLRLKCVNEL